MKKLKRCVICSGVSLGVVVYGNRDDFHTKVHLFEDSQGCTAYIIGKNNCTSDENVIFLEDVNLKGDKTLKGVIDGIKANLVNLESIYKTGKCPPSPELKKKAKEIYDIIRSVQKKENINVVIKKIATLLEE